MKPSDRFQETLDFRPIETQIKYEHKRNQDQKIAATIKHKRQI